MKWLTKNKNKIFIFFILIFFVNLNVKAETEAERRASIRYYQEHLDREEKKTQQEADRVYNERYGPGKTDYSYVPIYFILYPMVAFMICTILLWFIESWKKDYGWKRIEYTGFNLDYKNKKKFGAEDTKGHDPSTWRSYTIYRKIFFQNRDRFNGPIDLKEYYKLVVEYNLCSCIERRSEIVAVFTERNFGQPFLEEFKRKPHKDKKAELYRKIEDQKKLLVLPCPECSTDIDCNDAQDCKIYSCHNCAVYYKFRNEVGLIKC